jgi:hypothetical protein
MTTTRRRRTPPRPPVVDAPQKADLIGAPAKRAERGTPSNAPFPA